MIVKPELKKLKPYIKQVRGLTFKANEATDTPFDDSIAVLKANNITDMGFDESSLIYIDKRKVKQDQLIKAGDILLAASSGSKKVVGKNIFFEKDYPGSFGAFCKLVRIKSELHPEYLKHFFNTAYYRNAIGKSVQGANINNLKNEHLDNLEILIPILDDQIRIATLLSRVEALIAIRKNNLNQLDEFLKSTFLEMFGDPTRNRKGFKLRRLSEFYIDPKNGTKCGPFGSALKKEEYVTYGVPVWNMDNITTDGRLQPNVNMWITEDKFEEMKGYATINGDVIISRAGTVGKMCVLNTHYPKSIISTNLIRVRFGNELLPIYFVSLMTYCKGRVGNLRTGSDGAFTHMNTGILDKLQFPYPPIELQNEFASIFEKVETIRTLYQHSLDELENLYGALSQKAFRGELDLSRIPLEEKPPLRIDINDSVSVQDSVEPVIGATPDKVDHEKLLHQIFEAFVAEQIGSYLSMDDFWHRAEMKFSDHMDEESSTLGVNDYEKVKGWLFEMLQSGKVAQRFNEEKNRMELNLK